MCLLVLCNNHRQKNKTVCWCSHKNLTKFFPSLFYRTAGNANLCMRWGPLSSSLWAIFFCWENLFNSKWEPHWETIWSKVCECESFCAGWVRPMRLGFMSFLASLYYLSQSADYPEQRRQFPAWEWELFSSSSSAFQRFDGRFFHILMDHHWFWFDGFDTYDWLAHNRWEWAHFEGNLFVHISLFCFCSVSHSQLICFSIPFVLWWESLCCSCTVHGDGCDCDKVLKHGTFPTSYHFFTHNFS